MNLPPSPLTRLATRRAFTLIEILTVIAIIAVLAGLLLSTAGYVQEKAGNSRAQAEIQALSSALEAYKLDNGTYPASTGNATPTNAADRSSKVLIDALCPAPGPGNKVYFEIPPKMLQGYKAGTNYETLRAGAAYLVDPFGNSYHYQFPGATNRSSDAFFDLWSNGKDHQKNANIPAKWLKNW